MMNMIIGILIGAALGIGLVAIVTGNKYTEVYQEGYKVGHKDGYAVGRAEGETVGRIIAEEERWRG